MTLGTVTFVLVLWTAVAPSDQSVEQSPALARVGNRTVTVEEFRSLLMDLRKSGDQQRLVQTLTPSGRKTLLDQEIERLLLATAAEDRSLDKKPAIRLAMRRTADAVLAEALLREEVEGLDLSDPALRRYLEQHASEFRTQQRVKASHILVATSAEAERALAAIRDGRSFPDVARVTNIDITRAAGGDLGWISRGVMVKPFETALFELPVGGTSGIVQTSFGYHVIRADAIDPGQLPAFEVLRDRVRQAAIESRFRLVKAELASRYDIAIDEAALKATGGR